MHWLHPIIIIIIARTYTQVLLGYADGKTLRVAATGAGGVDEMAAALDDAQAMYGLFVSTAKFDQVRCKP